MIGFWPYLMIGINLILIFFRFIIVQIILWTLKSVNEINIRAQAYPDCLISYFSLTIALKAQSQYFDIIPTEIFLVYGLAKTLEKQSLF